MWYIFLRDRSDTELLISPKYNRSVKYLINKISYMQVEFAAKEDGFINVTNRDVTHIQDFIDEHKFWFDNEDEEYQWLVNLENELF